MKQAVSRRKVLVGAVATATVGAVGGAALLVAADLENAMLGYLRAVLPGVDIDEVSARRCIADFTADWSMAKSRAFAAAGSTIGIATVATVDARFELISRQCFTRFLRYSNFFDVADPRASIIVYSAPDRGAPCANPFFASA